MRILNDDLTGAAERWPDAPALAAEGERWSFAAWHERAASAAAALRAAGVQRGDRVALYLENGLHAAAGIYGALLAGAAFVPLNPSLRAEKLARLLRHSGARALLAESRLRETVAAALSETPDLRALFWSDAVPEGLPGPAVVRSLAELEPAEAPRVRTIDEDLAAILYTSGSTGEAKGVTLRHRNMAHASASIAQYLGLRRGDVILNLLPLSFDYGLYQVLFAPLIGATTVLERGFTLAGEVLRRLNQESVTVLPGVPTVFHLLLKTRSFQHEALPALRSMTNTGAALPGPTIEELRRRFPRARVFSMYGLTECKRVSYLPPAELDRRPDSVGVAMPGTEVYVADEAGEPVPPGEVGELMVRGGHLMAGYWNDPEGTAERLRPGRHPWEKVLATGDLFRQDEEGYLYFVARKDDLIKTRGERVAPREVEQVLYRLAGVREAAVVGVPDPLLGHVLHAFVEADPAAALTPQAVRAHCAQFLEEFRVPQAVRLLPTLPRTPNGKIDRLALAGGIGRE